MKRYCFWLPALLGCLALPAVAQSSTRDSAIALANRGQDAEALALLEKLAASDTTDRAVQERLAFLLLKTSKISADAEQRRQQRVRARQLLVRVLALGSTDVQVRALVESIPADGGSDAVFSANAEIDKTMQQAETAYSAGDARAALGLYQKALGLDPQLYNAALFSGDAYLRLQAIDSAYMWYAKAAATDPNRETAWRYWSDVLLKNGRMDDARDKAIEAVVAEPYSRISRQGLVAWAQKARQSMALPLVNMPEKDTANVHSPAWVAYDSVRRAWKGTDERGSAVFMAQYPSDRVYRHSVAEEKAALRAAWKASSGDSATINLKKLDDAGMLDAFILFVRPDAGIATEYPAYVREHRDILKRFWAEHVIGAPYMK